MEVDIRDDDEKMKEFMLFFWKWTAETKVDSTYLNKCEWITIKLYSKCVMSCIDLSAVSTNYLQTDGGLEARNRGSR